MVTAFRHAELQRFAFLFLLLFPLLTALAYSAEMFLHFAQSKTSPRPNFTTFCLVVLWTSAYLLYVIKLVSSCLKSTTRLSVVLFVESLLPQMCLLATIFVLFTRQVLGGEGVVVKDEGVQDTDGTVYALEDGRRDGDQQGTHETLAGFGQVSCAQNQSKLFSDSVAVN